MTSDPDKTAQDVSPSQHFVLLDETELHLPEAGDVVLLGDTATGSFWQAASGVAGEALPALEELVSDHAAQDAPAGFAALDAPAGAAPAEVFLLNPPGYTPAISAPSMVDIVVDDGSGGDFVA